MDVFYMIGHYNYMCDAEKARVRELARQTWRSRRKFIESKTEFCHGMARVILPQKNFDRYTDFMKTKYGYNNFLLCRRDIEKVEGIWQTWLKTIELK